MRNREMTKKEAWERVKFYLHDVLDSEEADAIIGALEHGSKTGHWIEVAKYPDGKHEIKCSECESHIFDRGHANSYVVKEKYKYCPRCGARMVEL